MKIKKEHYSAIRRCIVDLAAQNKTHQIYENVKNESRIKDFDKGFRWALFWAAKKSEFWPPNLLSEIYAYANDNHIDTALRKILFEMDNE